LSAACFSAASGHSVDVFEKNATPGGRARFFEAQGFGFDMGPSWYWMPDVFERFFGAFGHHPSDFYNLVQLDPGFRIYFGANDKLDVAAGKEALHELFEATEAGSSRRLQQFLADAKFKYNVGMQQLVYKPADSWSEYARWDVMKGMAGAHLFRSVRAHVRSYFKDPRLIALMEFPVLFLGAMPKQIPALYTLMNYAALELGTWYPMGGMQKIITGMQQVAGELNVNMHCNAAVSSVSVSGSKATGVVVNDRQIAFDGIISAADYHHTETKLLGKAYANYDESYWDEKVFAPSCLIFYLGVNKKIDGLIHHNLFFDTDFDRHADAIYQKPEWPENPLFYVCCPSKTDPQVAPPGSENLFILLPVATRLKDSPETREHYYKLLLQRLEKITGVAIAGHVVFRRDYCINDFVRDYNAYGGNAYGLANTLRQTAVLKPKMRNRKISTLFYAGQLTVPGPGIPPALISGEIAARQLLRQLSKSSIHERAF
jgi:phytoene desaturase